MRSLSLIAAITLLGSFVSADPHEHSKHNDNNSDVKHKFIMAYSEGQYILPVNVGTPGQGPINVVFDTGSDLTWFPGPGTCENCESEYNPSVSSTATKDGKKPVLVDYGDDQCATVTKYKDTLSFHGADELKFQSFPVGAASEIKGFDPSSNVGYFGLGNPDALYSINSALQNDVNRSKGKREADGGDGFGSYGGTPKRGSSQSKRWYDKKYGVLTIGIDHTAYRGDLYYFNLPASEADCENHSIFWRTSLTGVGLKDKHACNLLPKSYAKFSTGTRDIKAPPVHADFLHLKFGAIYNFFKHRYEFKCSKLDSIADLEFKFENYQINLPAKLWTARVNATDNSEDATCYTHIRRGSDRFKEWTLGTIVLDEFYQAWEHNMLRIGLGYLVDGSDNGATITKIQ